MKKCSKCKEIKPVTEYHKKRAARDGLSVHCKACNNKRQAEVRKREGNAQQQATYQHKYRRTVKGKSARNTSQNKRRAIDKGNSYAVCPKELLTIKELYKECLLLTDRTGIPHEVDHIIPISKGGSHTLDNLQILTRKQNRAKNNKPVSEALE